MSISTTDDQFDYYTQHDAISDPGDRADLYTNLPTDVSQLCSIIQGLLIHVHWAKRYGEELSPERETDVGIRHVAVYLNRILEIEDDSILTSRPLSKKIVGNCRTYSVLLASMLRSQGTPARARCGFGKYFMEGWHEDHWICEYWHEAQSRWIMVDAQLDDFQCRELKISFDPLDVPRDQFIVAGKAWLACRRGQADPENFGIFDMRGLWFIRGNLIRDVAALNKVPLLPWDGWGLIDREDSEITDTEMTSLDDVAVLTFDEVDFPGVREAYEQNEGLTVPAIIKSYTQAGAIKVDLSTEQVIE